MAIGMLSPVMYQINKVLLKQVGFHKVNRNLILMNVIQNMFGMMLMRFLTISWKNEVMTKHLRTKQHS